MESPEQENQVIPLNQIEIPVPLRQPTKQKPNVEEIILEELDPEEAKKLDRATLESSVKFPKGTKVRVIGYPAPSDFRNNFDWNNKEGIIVGYTYVGIGIGNRPTYAYKVNFSRVEIPFSRLNKETGKLQRGIRITEAENIFDEGYLDYKNE